MLRQRIITALVIAAVLLTVLLWIPPTYAVLVFGVVLLLGAWEWSAFVGLKQPSSRVIYVLVLALGMLAVWFGAADLPQLLVLLTATAFWWLAALIWIVACPTRVSQPMAAVAGALSLIPAWVALSRLQGEVDRGPELVLFLFVLIAMADIGAYLAGRRLGRNKLAPRVSPGKTWEGVAGGVAFALLAAVVGAYWFRLDTPRFVSLCFVVIVASVIGDLNESLFKRHVGLKDSSSLLPGHGGILDRIDSMTAAAPLFLLGLILLGIVK